MTQPTEPSQIENPTAKLLFWLTQGWTPIPGKLGTIQELRFGDTEIVDKLQSVSYESNCIKIQCLFAHQEYNDVVNSRNATLSGTTESGWEFHSENAYFKTINISGAGLIATIVGRNVTFERAGGEIKYWLGQIDHDLRFLGNLTVEAKAKQKTSSSRQLLLQGKHDYYFLSSRKDKQSKILIELAEGSDPHLYLDEFVLLRYALGANYKIRSLMSLDENCVVVGFKLGETLGVDPRENSPLIAPVRWDDNKEWGPVFFQKLSESFASKPNNLVFSIGYYLESASGYLDSKYVNLQIAINILSRYVLEKLSSDSSVLVDSSEEWIDWINTHRDDVFRHSTNHGEALLENLKEAMNATDKDILRIALHLLDIDVVDEYEVEIEYWNEVFRSGIMTNKPIRDVRKDLQRIAVLREIYSGPQISDSWIS